MIRVGDVVLATLDPTCGTEQAGQRPVIIIGGPFNWESLVIVVPLTTTDRGWVSHIPIHTDRTSFAMCEQVRAISANRISRTLTTLSYDELREVQTTVARLIGVYGT